MWGVDFIHPQPHSGSGISVAGGQGMGGVENIWKRREKKERIVDLSHPHPHPEFEMHVAIGQGMGFVEKGGEGRWVDLTYDLPSPSPSPRIQNRVWQRGG